MPIDTKLVGSNERTIVIDGDNAASGNLGSVLSIADAANFAGLFGPLKQAVIDLYNGSTYDRARSAIGTTGILAVANESTKATYSAGVSGFTPAATATDFFTIIGSATTVVRVKRITIMGIASSAANVAIDLVKRSTANTTGTAASVVIAPHDANDAAATAVVSTYSVNPGGLGTSVGKVRTGNLNLGIAGAAGILQWDFSTANDKAIVLRGIAQTLGLNWGGAAVPGGTSLSMFVEFTEE